MARAFKNWQRQEIWDKDKGRCGICGRKARWTNWEADHIHPYSWGGETEVYNGQVAHPWCNREKQANICYGFYDNGEHLFNVYTI